MYIPTRRTISGGSRPGDIPLDDDELLILNFLILVDTIVQSKK